MSLIIKPSPLEDVYMIWSTCGNNATGYGTREQVRQMLIDDLVAQVSKRVDADLDRTDERGSSSHARTMWWNNPRDYLTVSEGGPDLPDGEEGCWILRSDATSAYAAALLAGDRDAANALLTWDPA